MRRFLFLLMIYCLQGHAGYVGNPASPALMHGVFSGGSFINLYSGYVYTQVWDKNITSSNIPPNVTLEKVGACEMQSNFATVGINLVRRLELYSYLGVSKENIDWTAKFPFSSPEIKVKNHFSYVLGAKAIMLQFARTVFSLDFQYFTLPATDIPIPKIVSIYMPIPIGSQYIKLKEWQLAAGIASKLGPITPYVGVKYSRLNLDVNSTDLPTLSFKNSKSWGLFAGISLNFANILMATGEIRWVDEKAVSAAVSTAF